MNSYLLLSLILLAIIIAILMLPPTFNYYPTINENVVTSNRTDWGYSSEYYKPELTVTFYFNGEYQGTSYSPECKL